MLCKAKFVALVMQQPGELHTYSMQLDLRNLILIRPTRFTVVELKIIFTDKPQEQQSKGLITYCRTRNNARFIQLTVIVIIM